MAVSSFSLVGSEKVSSARRAGVSLSAAVGGWRVRRKIVDFRAGGASRFEGTATITARGFEEQGQLDLGHAVLKANRAYQLHFERDSVAVQFPDGSEFIELKRRAVQTVRHVCGRDVYVGRFFFVNSDTWVEAWRVTGPQKHYASVSRYTRITAKS